MNLILDDFGGSFSSICILFSCPLNTDLFDPAGLVRDLVDCIL